jgi:hypothetical protein
MGWVASTYGQLAQLDGVAHHHQLLDRFSIVSTCAGSLELNNINWDRIGYCRFRCHMHASIRTVTIYIICNIYIIYSCVLGILKKKYTAAGYQGMCSCRL